MPTFSIIVPVYNVEKYLPKCLDSLVNQTYSDIEIICINDGSPDNSLSILEEYAKNDNRIKIINQENQGVSVARNVGIDNATGDYIIFVDADDWIELNACEILSTKLSEQPDIICFKYNVNKKIKNKITKSKNLNYKYTKIDTILEFNSHYKNIINDMGNLMCCGRIYRTEFIKNNKIYYPENITVLEDAIFCIKNFLYNPKVLFFNEYLYNYLINVENSLTKQNIIKKLQQIEKVHAYIKEIIDTCSLNYLKEYTYNYFLRYLLYMWNDAYFSEHKKYYLDILSYYMNECKNNCFETFVIIDDQKMFKRNLLCIKKQILVL